MLLTAHFILSIFLLSQTTRLSRKSFLEISFILSRSNKIGIILYSLIYLPGTIIHEISHFFTAAFLGVRTGEINIIPKRSDKRLQMGSVQIQKTDFIRSSLIGVAPFVVGSISLLYLTSVLGLFSSTNLLADLIISLKNLSTVGFIQIYLLIAISNTLFTSKEDRRQWPVLIVISLVIYFAIILSGRNVSISQNIISKAQSGLMSVAGSFYIATIINLIIYILLGITSKILQLVLKTKIKPKQ